MLAVTGLGLLNALTPPTSRRLNADIHELDAVSLFGVSRLRHGAQHDAHRLTEQELTSRKSRIHDILTEFFSPSTLEVVDESHRHAGHAGARPEGETHFKILIVADALKSMSRIDGHRAINDALKHEFETGLHALTIRIG